MFSVKLILFMALFGIALTIGLLSNQCFQEPFSPINWRLVGLITAGIIITVLIAVKIAVKTGHLRLQNLVREENLDQKK